MHGFMWARSGQVMVSGVDRRDAAGGVLFVLYTVQRRRALCVRVYVCVCAGVGWSGVCTASTCSRGLPAEVCHRCCTSSCAFHVRTPMQDPYQQPCAPLKCMLGFCTRDHAVLVVLMGRCTNNRALLTHTHTHTHRVHVCLATALGAGHGHPARHRCPPVRLFL